MNDDNDPYVTDSFLCLCRNCGFIFIPTWIIRCPGCDNGNICNVPIKNHPNFTLDWLNDNGFPFIETCLEVKHIVK